MTEPARSQVFTFAEYLEQERTSETKHELINGVIFAMAGGTPEHARLSAKMAAELGARLRGRPCAVFSSDLRVRVPATGLATYPDVSIVCGRLELDPKDENTATNPIVLVEVLSDSTEAYDRGEKFAHYRHLASLKEYVLISQNEARIEVFRRNEDGKSWTLHIAEAAESATLVSIGCELPVDEVYANPLAAS